MHRQDAIAKADRAAGDVRRPADAPEDEERGAGETPNQEKDSESHDRFSQGSVASSRHGPATSKCRAAWRPGLRRYRGAAHPGGRQIRFAIATNGRGVCCRPAAGP